jgi:enoyl-CoA hydratase
MRYESTNYVKIETREDVALVTVARPPANALNPELLADGLAVLDALRADPPPALVITGIGRFFCSGADLREVPALPPDGQAEMARRVNRLFEGWHTFPRPVVCAVNGHAVAGGLILALCGDYRVGPTSGRFGLTEVKVGIPYPSEAMAVVHAELAPSVARRLVLLGELFDSAAAAGFGIFDEVVADDEVVERAVEVAQQFAALPPRTFEVVKQQLRAGARDHARGAFGGANAAGFASSEAAEAGRAVLDGTSTGAGASTTG